jgi:hypothetical protein
VAQGALGTQGVQRVQGTQGVQVKRVHWVEPVKLPSVRYIPRSACETLAVWNDSTEAQVHILYYCLLILFSYSITVF